MTVYIVSNDDSIIIRAFATRQKAEDYIKAQDEACQQSLNNLGITFKVTAGLGIEEVEVEE